MTVEYKKVYKITENESGHPEPYWHWVASGQDRTICVGHDLGSTDNIEKIGKVTCPKCIEIIKEYKSVKL